MVGSFVTYPTLVMISRKTTSPIFNDIFSKIVPNITINRRSEYLPIAIALLGYGLRDLHQIWQSDRYWAARNNIGMKYNF